MEQAVYWTEYVIRHKGAPHLRSAVLDLAWYQYFLLDVIAVLALVAVSLLVAMYCVSKAVIRALIATVPRMRKSVVKKNEWKAAAWLVILPYMSVKSDKIIRSGFNINNFLRTICSQNQFRVCSFRFYFMEYPLN